MGKILLKKKDHRLYLVPMAILSAAIVTHVKGREGIGEIEFPVKELKPGYPDLYGNMRRNFPLNDLDEISMTLVFEQGWDQVTWESYPPSESVAKKEAKKTLPGGEYIYPSYTTHQTKYSYHNPDKGFYPYMDLDKKPFMHTHWVLPADVPSVEYAPGEAAHILNVAETFKVLEEVTEAQKYPSSFIDTDNIVLENELSKVIFDKSLEEKYQVSVVVQKSTGMSDIVKVRSCYGVTICQKSLAINPFHSFYEVSELVKKAKAEVIGMLIAKLEKDDLTLDGK